MMCLFIDKVEYLSCDNKYHDGSSKVNSNTTNS